MRIDEVNYNAIQQFEDRLKIQRYAPNTVQVYSNLLVGHDEKFSKTILYLLAQ